MSSKLLLLFSALLLSTASLFAQGDLKMPGLDKSPADISVFNTEEGPLAKVVYSRPQKNDRDIFGALIPYGKVWRTGANEATTITFYEDVMFGGEMIEAGTYALFTVPGQDEWKIMLNSNPNQWGAYRMDAKKTVLETSAEPTMTETVIEPFTITFRKVDGGAHLVMAWDQTMVEVPIMMP